MSRVHDALRRASQDRLVPSRQQRPDRIQSRLEEPVAATQPEKPTYPPPSSPSVPVHMGSDVEVSREDMEALIHAPNKVPYNPQKDALVVNIMQPREAPAEEFRTLRTRLNHLQSSQPLHTLVVTSASPAEGKSFTATNLAISQAQLADKRVLLADFDFRRPSIHTTFQIECSPGITDYLVGQATLGDIIQKVAGLN